MKKRFLILLLLPLAVSAQSKRPLRPDDIYILKYVGSPEPSPDGKWIAYTIRTMDSSKDKQNTDIWMVSRDGTQNVQLTNSPDGEGNPQWSPDGKWLSFTASRQGGSQIWLLDRRGGEAQKLTEVKGELSDYAWSPDAKKLVLELKEPLDSGKNDQPAKPFVINKYHFKQDVSGYLWDVRKTHLYLFDVDAKKLDTLTKGLYNESGAMWSPDGTRLAFISNHTEEPDKNENTDLFIIEAKASAQARQLTTWTGADNEPQWSPDGKSLAYLRSTSNENYIMYDQSVLCVQPVDGGDVKLLSKALDRPVTHPRWAKDGKSIGVLIADDCTAYVGLYNVGSGSLSKLTAATAASVRWKPCLAGLGWLACLSRNNLQNFTQLKKPA